MTLIHTTPEEVTQYVVNHFDAVSEEQIGQWERDVARASPDNPESGLLYALRISKCVPTVKSFKALDSRWRTACNGVRGLSGSIGGAGFPNRRATEDFLVKLYADRVEELCQEIVAKAEEESAKRKTGAARCTTLYDAIDKIEQAYHQVNWVPDPRPKQRAWIGHLDKKLKALGVENLESGVCDACGEWPRKLTRIGSGDWVCRTCLREIRA